MSTSPTKRITRRATERATALTKPWAKRTLIGVFVFVVLFGLFGYFALPGIIKSQVEKRAAEKLHRQLRIDTIKFQPFALALSVHGLKLLEPDGKAVFVAFDNLYVNISAQSLFRFAPVVKEVRLQKPYVHLARITANKYNIDDILKLIASQPPSSSKEPARFAAYNLQVDGGRIEFDDVPVHARHIISELKLGLPFISSLPSKVDVFVEPQLSAKVNDAPFALTGHALPFAAAREATLALNLDDVDLTRYIEYLPYQPRFKLPSAKLDVHLTAIFRQPKDKTPVLLLKGTTALRSLDITDPDGKPMIKVPRLSIAIDELSVMSSTLAIASIVIQQPEIQIVQGADGSLNLQRLAPPAQDKASTNAAPRGAAKEEEQPPRLQLTLKEFAIEGARLNYRDEMRSSRPVGGGMDKFNLHINDTAVDVQKRMTSIGEISSSSAAFNWLHGKSITDPVQQNPIAAHSKSGAPSTTATASDPSPAYTYNIAKINIDGWSARLEDRNLPQPAVTTINAFKLAAQNISNAANATGRIAINAGVNKQGQLAVSGDIGLAPLRTDLALDLKSVDLMPLQPYVTDQVNLLVTRAVLSSKSALKLDQAGDGKLNGTFKGDVAVNDFATIDKISSNDFVRWKGLAFSGVNVQLEPLAIGINQVALNDFFARVIVDANGRINLQDVASSGSGETKSLTQSNGSAPAGNSGGNARKDKTATSPQQSESENANAGGAATAMPPIKIRQVKLQGGRVRFSDNFIKPNYSADLMALGGTVSGLSSDAASNADIQLKGNVNSAPLNIAGRINPLKKDLSFDIKADVKGMELAPLSPYSGKYIGYGIEKGRLSFEVAYHLDDRKLEAQNRLILDQLTLGEKMESPSATTLPVQLALSLLSDRNGIIDINLPIGGSLDDPQFSVGGIIVKVLVNLITKAVTAPFALLGSMFGGGEELSWLGFDAGRHTIPADGETRLNTLAKALNDRPALKLEITGHYDEATDREGLRRAGIERKVRALKLKQLVGKGESADVNSITVSEEEYPALLAKVYKSEDFSKPRNVIGLQKDLPVEEMEKLMMENTKVADGDMIALGNRRAQAAKDWLIDKGAVPADRIFIVAAKPGDANEKAKPNRVDFSLR